MTHLRSTVDTLLALALTGALLVRPAVAQPATNALGADFKRAETDLDRSSAYLATHLAKLTKELKELAAEADVAGQKDVLETKLGELYNPHKAAVTMLLVQTYLAAFERAIADRGLEAQAVKRVTEVWALPEGKAAELRLKGLNWSSIILGCSLAKVAGKTPAEVLELYEKGQSWSQIAASLPGDIEALGGEIEKVLKG